MATQFLFQVVGFDCVDDESMPDPKVELLSLGFVATQHLWGEQDALEQRCLPSLEGLSLGPIASAASSAIRSPPQTPHEYGGVLAQRSEWH